MGESTPLTVGELTRAFLAFLLLAIVSLGVNPFRGEIVGPFDVLLSQPGWGEVVPLDHVRHMERSDVLDYFLPRWIEARSELRQGRLPLWNPLPAGGEPGILNPASGELTPAFLIFVLAPSVQWGLLAAVLFNLAFGATGLYAFVRRHATSLPGFFAGATVMLCGFTAAWLYWPHVSTALWIGWLLWGIDGAMQSHRGHAVIRVAVPLAGLLLGGFPFVSLLGLGTAALYIATALAVDPARRRRQVAGRLAIALCVALGLSAPGLLGFAEWLGEFDLSERTFGSILTYRDGGWLLPAQALSHPSVETSMYVGTTGLVLAVLAVATRIGLFIMRRRQPTLAEAFSMVLLACSIVLVFELVPRELLAWVPGLSGNRWTRAISIMDIALALNAALLIQRAGTYLRRNLFVVLAIGLLAVQAGELVRYFRLFNGPVVAAAYYPDLPLVDRLKSERARFQSVVADQSFLVSGTLGAYGLPEWLGHGFRTEALKKVLGDIATDPLTSATSSRIASGAFHLDSPTLSALGVRYALGDDGLVSSFTGVPVDATMVSRAPFPPMPSHTLVQHVTLGETELVQGVSFRFATYGRSMQSGALHVELTGPGSDDVLAHWDLPVASIPDNSTRSFGLPAALSLQPGRYAFRLSYVGASEGDLLTVWGYPGQWGNCSGGVEGQPPSGCMDFGLMTRRTDLGHFTEIASAQGIHLLENKDVPSGAYFLADMNERPHASSSDPVSFIEGGSTGFILRYTGSSHGFVVTPMSWRSGWRVTSNAMPVKPQKYLGILPAVAVDGPTEIIFHYRPMALRVGVPIALVTMLAFLFGSWLVRRRLPSSHRAHLS